MSFLGLYSSKEFSTLQDQYQQAKQDFEVCRKELIDLKTRTNPMIRENASPSQKVYDLNRENTLLIDSMKSLSDNFNIERERVQTEIEKSMQIELACKKEELYSMSILLRDARSIIDHLSRMEGANFYINDMIKFIKEKQIKETPKHDA